MEYGGLERGEEKQREPRNGSRGLRKSEDSEIEKNK